MSRYRRLPLPGRTWFFTVNLLERRRRLLVEHIDLLCASVRAARMARPFEVVAMVVLPDHLHCIWRLPEGDADNAARWSHIKAEFSRGLPATAWRNASRRGKRERGIWQRRFWARVIVDDDDLRSHVDDMHYNPVKHGHVVRAVDWPHSSVHRWIARGDLPSDLGVAPVGDIQGHRVGLGPPA